MTISLVARGVVCLLTAFAAYAEVPGRVAFWRAERNTWDSEGGSPGMATVSTSYGPDRNHAGSAFYYPGSGIPLTDSMALSRLTGFSIAAWVRTEAIQPERQSVFKLMFSNGGPAYELSLAGSLSGAPLAPEMSVYLMANGPGLVSGLRTATASQGCGSAQWCHIAGTFDRTMLKVYVNGVLSGSLSVVGLGLYDYPAGQGFIGASKIDGAIDEVQFFARPLTDEEILTVYHTPDPPPPGLPGPKGDPGPPGPAGSQGVAGTAGISGRQRVSSGCGSPVRLKKGDVHDCQLACPAGKAVFGGGVSQAEREEGLTLVSSWPSADGIWSLLLRNDGKLGAFTLQGWAICAATSN